LNQCVAAEPTCSPGLYPRAKTCSADCKATWECVVTPTPSPTYNPNSCADSDGGLNYFVRGTITGSVGGLPYTVTDSCQDSSVLLEFYCPDEHTRNGVQKSCSDFNSGNSYYACINGVCAVTVTPTPSPSPSASPTPSPSPSPSPSPEPCPSPSPTPSPTPTPSPSGEPSPSPSPSG
jgi:hypothetical protein